MMAPIKLEEEEDEAAARRARLADSLSASYPSQALSKSAFEMDPGEMSDGEKDPLSASCYAEIRLDKVKLEDLDSDDELTSLSWLQDTDLLRNIRMDSCTSPMDDEDEDQKENEMNLQNSGIYGVPHPPHVPYNPQKHVNSKPPYSFSCLIFMSIEDSPEKKLPVKDIYNWILTHFPYFQNAPTGWKNSVRHNLSLNKCFKKVEKDRCSVSTRFVVITLVHVYYGTLSWYKKKFWEKKLDTNTSKSKWYQSCRAINVALKKSNNLNRMLTKFINFA